MSTATSQVRFSTAGSRARAANFLTVAEILAVFTGILLYIWQWQYSHPRLWIPMLVFVVLSHAAHRDSLRDLGLTFDGMLQNAKIILPLALLILAPAFAYGLAVGSIRPQLKEWPELRYFGGYVVWCIFQQYLTQSYFHNRIMRVVESRHVSSAITALMFGAAHIPNPVLMAVTTLGGFILSEVFARYRNIWPLALVQAVSGVLLATLAPAAIIHNMRVGPGYFFYNRP
ncbi:MAG: type II CAAX prenyl endopeptidase Rce1 family protein [Deltaproteobacteria bacterium]